MYTPHFWNLAETLVAAAANVEDDDDKSRNYCLTLKFFVVAPNDRPGRRIDTHTHRQEDKRRQMRR